MSIILVFIKEEAMERKKKLFQSLNFIILVIMVITTISHSLCFANISSPLDSEMRNTFSNIMDTELGDTVKAFFEEKGLEIDLENGLSTTALGNEITFMPLISKKSHQKSQLLAYIDHETAGRLLVFPQRRDSLYRIMMILKTP